MTIKGIQTLEVEERPDGTYSINITYTQEFVNILKKVLKKQKITDKDVLAFVNEALDSI
jgi:hypothetical protein